VIGTITDGSDFDNYGSFADCAWIIAPSLAQEITITFSEFSTEAGFDFVRVFQCVDVECLSESREQIGELSGVLEQESSFTISTGYMLVTFTSDSSVEEAGFFASWTSSSEVGA
jgi:hypothetical protein